MKLTYMRPGQLRDAVAHNVPCICAAGSVEYHGPHLPVGTDYLIAQTVCDRVEERCACVQIPPLPFSSTMSWAAGPEEGEVDFDPDALFLYAREVLRSVVRMGFRRIYVVQHHQGPEGLPSLCLRRAAAEVIREATRPRGAGWGRRRPEELANPAVFSLIRIASIDAFCVYEHGELRVPVGHGGRGETQLIMAGPFGDTVDMDRLGDIAPLPRWLEDARLASPEEGERWIELCVDGWVRELTGTASER